jgi:hypothetical protein
MSEKRAKTRLAEDGLRYTSKKSGTPFLAKGTTRSCFKCGQHRAQDQMKAFHFLARSEMVCKPSCSELAKTQP